MVSRNFRQTHLLDFHPWTFFWAFKSSPLSVKWTWTVSAFLTNESSYIAMVKGLHTRAKGHDHVIVRALDSHPRAEPRAVTM